MTRPWLLLLALPLCLGLAGCFSGQKKQLAACEVNESHNGEGQPLKSIQACMDQNGYSFVGYANTDGPTLECDLTAVIRGVPSANGTDAQCFQPKGWLALKIYHIEVPTKAAS